MSVRPATRARPGRRAAAALVWAVLLAVAVVTLSPLADSDVVTSKEQQASVDLGWPWPWVRQDQSGFDPPLPWRMRAHSIWEYPTSLSPVMFAADTAVVFACVTAAGGAAGVLGQRVARRRRGGAGR